MAPPTISIHALLAESDLYDTYAKVLRVNISIHALLAESDAKIPANIMSHLDFYPRSPCGERLKLIPGAQRQPPISIHALLAESDGHQADGCRRVQDFYPRSPCGERQRGPRPHQGR